MSAADAERVARFERERARFTPRDDDVFVVTYPRSGTTWTLFLVHLLKTGGDDDFEHLSEVAPWFERGLALGQRSAGELDALAGPRVFKSHAVPSLLPARGRFVYVERDGRDVALSYFHLYRTYLGFEGDFDAFFARFLAGDLQYGSWFAHREAWADDDERALLRLRFEDMKRAPLEHVRRVAAFLELPLTAEREARVVELIHFDRMKEREARFDFAREARAERRSLEERRFLREGQVGAGRACLSELQRGAFEEAAQRPPRRFDRQRDLAAFLR